MISTSEQIMIPDSYRKQSEIENWLPGAAFIQSKQGQDFIEGMFVHSRRRKRLMKFNLIAGVGLISAGILSYIELPSRINTISFAEILFSVSIPVSIGFLGAYLIKRFLHNGLWAQDEPILREQNFGVQQDNFNKLCDYWEKFLNSDYNVIVSVGKNGLGIPQNYKNSEYGILALAGNPDQRHADAGGLKLFAL